MALLNISSPDAADMGDWFGDSQCVARFVNLAAAAARVIESSAIRVPTTDPFRKEAFWRILSKEEQAHSSSS
jgi:hypothetical protein